jgi:hypothetical protein
MPKKEYNLVYIIMFFCQLSKMKGLKYTQNSVMCDDQGQPHDVVPQIEGRALVEGG